MTITTKQLNSVYSLAIGSTEGAKDPYKMVDAWKAYTGSIVKRANETTLLKGLTYEEVVAKQAETITVDGTTELSPAAQAAKSIVTTVNSNLMNAGQSIGVGQYDFGGRVKELASKVNLPGAFATETVGEYVIRHAFPDATDKQEILSSFTGSLKDDYRNPNSTVKPLTDAQSATLSTYFKNNPTLVDLMDQHIRDEFVLDKRYQGEVKKMASLGWSEADQMVGQAFVLKTVNQAYFGSAYKAQSAYLSKPGATLDELLKLGNKDALKAANAARLQAAFKTSSKFAGFYAAVEDAGQGAGGQIAADAKASLMLNMMSGGSGSQIAECVRAIDDNQQSEPLLFKTLSGMAICDTGNNTIYLPEGNGKYTILTGNDSTYSLTEHNVLSFTATANGTSFSLSSSAGQIGSITGGKIGVIGADGKSQYIEVPTKASYSQGELEAIGKLLGSDKDAGNTASAAKSLVKTYGWEPGTYEITDTAGRVVSKKELAEVKAAKPKTTTKKVAWGLEDDAINPDNLVFGDDSTSVTTVNEDNSKTIEIYGTNSLTGNPQYARLDTDAQGNPTSWVGRIEDPETGDYEEARLNWDRIDGVSVLTAQSLVNGNSLTGDTRQVVNTSALGGDARFVFLGDEPDDLALVSASDTEGDLGFDAFLALDAGGFTPDDLFFGSFEFSSKDALFTLAGQIHYMESGPLLLSEGDGFNLVRTGQFSFGAEQDGIGDDVASSIEAVNFAGTGLDLRISSRVVDQTWANGATLRTEYGLDDELLSQNLKMDLDGHFVELAGRAVMGEDGESRVVLQEIVSIDGQPPLASLLLNNALANFNISGEELAQGYLAGSVAQLVNAGNPLDPLGFKLRPPVPTAGDPTPKPWYEDDKQVKMLTGQINSVASLLAAIRSGKPLAIATNAFDIAAAQEGAAAWVGETSSALDGVSSVVGFRDSFIGMRDALRRGDYLTATVSGANSVRLGMTIYQKYLGAEIATKFNSINEARALTENAEAATMVNEYDQVAGMTESLGQVLNKIGAAIDLFGNLTSRHPNYVDMVMDVLVFIPPYGPLIAAAYQLSKVAHQLIEKTLGETAADILGGGVQLVADLVNELLADLFGTDEFDIYGKARFVSNGDGRSVQAVLWEEGDDGGGDGALAGMQAVRLALDDLIKDMPDLGLVARRLPGLNFYTDEDGENPYFELVIADPVTGTLSTRLFDTSGNRIARPPNEGRGGIFGSYFNEVQTLVDPAKRGDRTANDGDQSMFQQFMDAAMQSDAFAPSWYVKTIDAQASRGYDEPVYEDVDNGEGGTIRIQVGTRHVGPPPDPHAGLTMLQRAYVNGQLLSVDAGDAVKNAMGTMQAFSPVVLDLDGNGIQLTGRDDGGSVLVDVDDDGYAEETDWISPRDALLVVDWNGDGYITGGHEMLSDSRVDMVERGIHVLDELDADGDAKINAADYAYDAVRVWQDINHDGVVQDFELSKLADRHITELDISGGQFTVSGEAQTHLMAVTPLQADRSGVIVQANGNSALIINEDIRLGDKMSLMVIALADADMITDAEERESHVHESADGDLLVADEMADGAEDVSLVVSVEQLLDNDFSLTYGFGASEDLFINPDYFASENGKVKYDWEKKTITFRPDSDFNGLAKVDYVVEDKDGRRVTAAFYVNVSPVNDGPVITNRSSVRRMRVEDLSVGPDGVYVLPPGADWGDSLADPSKITVLGNATQGPYNNGQIGQYNGVVYWANGTDDYGVQQWHSFDFVDQLQGRITLSDVDSETDQLKFEVLSNPLYGSLSMDKTTGHWRYQPHAGTDGTGDSFLIEARDGDGGITQMRVLLDTLYTDTAASLPSQAKNLVLVGKDNLKGTGNHLDNIIKGTEGNDYIYGAQGRDTIEGGRGDDYLQGGEDADVYLFNLDSGHDVINDWNPENILRFGEGIDPSEVTVRFTDSFSALRLDIKDGVGSVWFMGSQQQSWNSDPERDNGIGTVEFADGTVWSAEQLRQRALQGTGLSDALFGGNGAENIVAGNGDDYVLAGAGDDTIEGGAGKDSLIGGAGQDTYVFGKGWGRDTIFGEAGDPSDGDKIVFDESIDPSKLTFKRTRYYGDDLTIGLTGSGSTIVVERFFRDAYGEASGVDGVIARGGNLSWTYEDIAALCRQATAGSDIIVGANIAERLTGEAGNDTIEGGEGNDTLNGGAGDDQLDGGLGDDTYEFGLDSGKDKIFISGRQSGQDVILLDAGIETGDVSVRRGDYSDLVLTLNDSSSTLTISGYFSTYSHGDWAGTQIAFAGGTRWDMTAIDQMTAVTVAATGDTITGTSAGEQISEFSPDSLVVGHAGDDSLTGWGRNDTLDGGAGNDRLDAGVYGVYKFGRNSGNDAVIDLQNGQTVLLDEGITIDDVVLTEYGIEANEDLVLSIKNSTSTLTFWQYFNEGVQLSRGWQNFGDSKIKFSDGTIWTYTQIEERAVKALSTTGYVSLAPTRGDSLVGGAGNDVLYGDGGGDDTFVGGGGDDIFYGGDGNNVFEFGAGDGNDTVYALDNYRDHYRIQFDSSVQVGDVALKRVGDTDDLLLSIKNATSSILLSTYFLESYRAGPESWKFDEIRFSDNTSWNVEQVKILAMAPTTSGNDTIAGYSSADYLRGGAGNDVLQGNEGDDTLDGGAGDDLLRGNGRDKYKGGNETYIFGRASGHDTIEGSDEQTSYEISKGGNKSFVLMDADVSANDVSVRQVGGNGDFLISIANSDATLLVKGWHVLDGLRFANHDADISWWELYKKSAQPTGGNDTIIGLGGSDEISGGAGNDLLKGEGGRDTLDGDAGDDLLYGGSQSDTYKFGRNSGNDTIDESVGNDSDDDSASDTLLLDADVRPEDIVVTRPWSPGEEGVYAIYGGQLVPPGSRSNDLILSIVGSNSSVRIVDYFYPNDHQGRYYHGVERIQFADGTVWMVSDVRDMVDPHYTIETDYLTGFGGSDSLQGGAGADALYGGLGNDTIDGGAGNDDLDGGYGDDTYIVDRNSGHDIIHSRVALAERNVLRFADGIRPDEVNVRLSDTGDDVVFEITEDDVVITAAHAETPEAAAIQLVKFGDGTTWYVPDLVQPLLMKDPTPGNDVIFGTEDGEAIDGLAGNDTLDGRDGDDTLDGGLGDDLMIGAAGADTYKYMLNSGNDTISDQPDLGFFTDVLQFSNVDPTKVTLTKNDQTGDLIVGTLLGQDTVTLRGYFGDPEVLKLFDAAIEQARQIEDPSVLELQGIDPAVLSDPTKLAAARDAFGMLFGNVIEEIRFDGGVTWDHVTIMQKIHPVMEAGLTVNGSADADSLMGGQGNDTLTGEAGNDTLDGGAGADILVGGAGDDVYIVDNAGDQVIELADGAGYVGGNDEVKASVDYTLSANIEWLTLTGTANINGTGNAGSNYLEGNTGNNHLVGGAGMDAMDGGTGNDTLEGGADDDVYYVYGSSDVVVELAGEGTDQVWAYGDNVTLSANVEQLLLATAAAITGRGNALDNYIRGSSAGNIIYGLDGNDTLYGMAGSDTVYGGLGNDSINGGSGNDSLLGETGQDTLDGGTGADILAGGADDDVYIVDNAGDQVIELADGDGYVGGNDEVKASVDHTLAANIEWLTLTGTANINATGNTLANVLTGNAGANTLTGGGGNDTYRAGGGNDTLTANVATSNDVYLWGRGEGADTLSDVGGVDRLDILPGVMADQVWLRKVNSNLEISVIGTTDTFTVSNWYVATANQVESLKLADGKTLAASNVQNLVNAMASFAPPPQGQATLPDNYRNALGAAISANWV